MDCEILSVCPYNSRDDERWNETWEEEGEGVESLLTGVHGTLSK